MTPTPAGLRGSVIIHPCPSTSRIKTRTAMRIAAHGVCVCRCILYYSFYLATAHWCHPFHPLYYSERAHLVVGIGEGLTGSVRVLLEVLAKDACDVVFPFGGGGLVDV